MTSTARDAAAAILTAKGAGPNATAAVAAAIARHLDPAPWHRIGQLIDLPGGRKDLALDIRASVMVENGRAPQTAVIAAAIKAAAKALDASRGER